MGWTDKWKANPQEPRWPVRQSRDTLQDTLAEFAAQIGRPRDPTQAEVLRVVTAFATSQRAIPELKSQLNEYAAALDTERRARQMAEQAARVAEKQLATQEDRYQELLAKHTRVMTKLAMGEAAIADAKRAGDDYDPPPTPAPQRPRYAEHPQRAETEAVLERAVMGPQYDPLIAEIGETFDRVEYGVPIPGTPEKIGEGLRDRIRGLVARVETELPLLGADAKNMQPKYADMAKRLESALRTPTPTLPPEPAPQSDTDQHVQLIEEITRQVEVEKNPGEKQ